MPHETAEPLGRRDAEQLVDIGGRDPLVAHGQQLFQQRLAVAHRAGRPAGQDLQRLRLDRDAFGGGNLREPRLDGGRADAGEIEPLAARQNRDRNLLRLGRGEDELHMLGRLFERLQKRVERLLREHVDFVDDVDLEPHAAGPHGDVLPQLANLVDAAVAGAVDLEHVDIVARRPRAGRRRIRCRASASGRSRS